MRRWMVEITYLDGRPPQILNIEELEELQEIVEKGPNWNLIDEIKINLNRVSATPQKEVA